MSSYIRPLLIERALSQLKPVHWPFKGSWQKSTKRGAGIAKQRRWVRQARKLFPT